MVGTFGFGSGGGVESAITAHASTHLNEGTDPIGHLPLLNVTQTFTAYQTLSAGLAVQGGTTLTGAFNLVTSGNTASITGNTSIVGGLTVSAGLTLSSGGISITGNSSVAGTFSTTGLYTASGGITVSSGVLTVSSGGASITGNSTITGTLGGLTGLTVASGGANITGNSTITGTLGGLTGLTVASGGASITGNSTITGTLGGLTGLTVASGNAIITAGNVGIGTSSPAGKLHVWGESYLGGSVSGNTAILLRNLSGLNRIDSYDYPITQNYPLSILGSYIILSTTDTERVRINNNGVGIGTSSPGQLLDVAGTARATNFIPSGLTGATTAVRIVGGTTNASPTTGTFVAGDMVIGSTSGAIYICTTGGTPGNWTTVGSGATTVFNKSFLLMGG